MRYLIAAILLAASPAWAQIVYTSAGGAQPLDGATVKGSIHIELQQATGGPWSFALDGNAKNVESGAPYVLANESGNVDDGNLWNTSRVADGVHTVTAKGASSTLTAKFTVANAAVPQPPGPPVWTGSTTLSWTPPLENTDGTPLTDLAGYRIQYGKSAAALSQTISVSAGVRSYIVDNLAAGTWYFAVKAFNTAGSEGDLSAIVNTTLVADTTPSVDCAVSPYTLATSGPWTPAVCATGTQTRTETWTRVVVIPASNGGAACPALSETRTGTQSCTVPPTDVWVVAKNGTSTTRPVYEAVLPLTGTALTRGNQDGTVAVGTPCGTEIFQQSKSSYREVLDASAVLASPTYRGRQHVAICTKQ